MPDVRGYVPRARLGARPYGTFASVQAPPISQPRWHLEQTLKHLEAHWGEGVLLPANTPSLINHKAALEWVARLSGSPASPGSIVTLMRANDDLDVRPHSGFDSRADIDSASGERLTNPGRCRTLPGGAHPGSPVRGDSGDR